MNMGGMQNLVEEPHFAVQRAYVCIYICIFVCDFDLLLLSSYKISDYRFIFGYYFVYEVQDYNYKWTYIYHQIDISGNDLLEMTYCFLHQTYRQPLSYVKVNGLCSLL